MVTRLGIRAGSALLAFLLLAVTCTAAASVASNACCSEDPAVAKAPCHAIAAAACCNTPLAVHAAAKAPSAPLQAAPAPLRLEIPRALCPLEDLTCPARLQAPLLRSTVLRL